MNRFKELVQFRPKNFPWVLLGISFVAFGVFIPWLGFYQDDWNHIYAFSQGGAEGIKSVYFRDSRPFAHWLYNPLFYILGVKPLGWQLYSLFARFAGVYLFWHVLNLLWKDAHKRNAMITALFLVYPIFLLQPMSVMFAIHWTMYILYMLSLIFMLKAFIHEERFSYFFVLSAVFEILHLFMLEYFVGIELLRPFIIFVFFRELPRNKRITKAIKAGLPFLLIVILYIIFRSSYGTLLNYDRNVPVVLLQLFKSPLSTTFYLIQVFFQDFAEIFFTAWYDTLKPALFTWERRTDLVIWLGVVIFALFWSFYFSAKKNPEADPDIERWTREVLFLGFFATLFGIAPGWAVGKTVHTSNPLWNDRFAIASMFGAAMLLTGFVFLLFKRNRYPFIFLGVLVSLAVGANLRSALSYKASWEKQQDFYWQLYWRAPAIEENTAFVSDQEFLFYMGAYPTSFAINTLYNNVDDFSQTNYWVYVGGEHLPKGEAYQKGVPITFDKYASIFQGNIDNTLPVVFEPEAGQCLWILRPEDNSNRNLSDLSRQYASQANIHRITSVGNEPLPLNNIFGNEPKRRRCYYYEKADLARQYEDWNEVIRLWNVAEAENLLPDSGVEYVPFIQAFAHVGDWSKADELTLRANKITDRMSPFLCSVWKNLDHENAPIEILENISQRLSCEALLND